MIDATIERRLESCRQLMQAWHTFHGYLTACMKGQKFDAQAEAAFLQLKSQIALLHDAFLESVDSTTREAAATSQSIITIVERCILLRQMLKMTPAEMKKMEMEWHEAYLLINETIGILEEQVSHLATIGQTHHMLETYGWKALRRFRHFFTSRAFVGTAIGLAVVIGLIVLPLTGILSYDMLDKNPSTRPAYRFTRNAVRLVYGNVRYLDWADYEKCNVTTDLEKANFKKDTPQPTHIEDMLKQIAPSGKLENVLSEKPNGEPSRFVRDSTNYDTLVVFYNDLPSAKLAMDNFEKSKQASTNTVEYDKRYRADRSGNVVAVCSPIGGLNPPDTLEALRMVLKKH